MKTTPIAARTQIVSSIVVILALIGTLVLFSWINSTNQKRILNEKTLQEIESIQVVINDSYTLGDIIGLRKYLDTFSKLNSWEYGQLTDSAGTELWKFGKRAPTNNSEISFFQTDINSSGGGKVAHLEIEKNQSAEIEKWKKQELISIFGLIAIGFIVLLIQNFTIIRILKPVSDLTKEIQNEANQLNLELSVETDQDDIYLVKKWFKEITLSWHQEKERSAEESKFRAIGNFASQVSHDIRSPLAALEMISSTLNEMPEEKRLVIRQAINRIRDIANSLLEKNRLISQNSIKDYPTDKNSLANEEPSIVLLSPLIDSITTEKRIQFRDKIDIRIEFNQSKESYGLFAKIQPNEFKRVISNLINNSLEAFSNNEGIVEVILTKNSLNQIEIQIKDNGIGISESILDKIGNRGLTYGKASGSGLGLYHAIQTIEASDGVFKIESKPNQGTLITIVLKNETALQWFVPKIILNKAQTIIILDDDQSIHQVWNGRLESLDHHETLNVLHFSNTIELRKYYSKNFIELENAIFLMDFEINGSSESGLDVIEALGIQTNSILVTSRYDEKNIRERCNNLGIKLIPKSMSGFVPIEIELN